MRLSRQYFRRGVKSDLDDKLRFSNIIIHIVNNIPNKIADTLTFIYI